MKQKIIVMLAVLSLLLSGCSWLDGYYVHVTDHREQSSKLEIEAVSAVNHIQLYDVLKEMIASGTQSAIIYVAEYDRDILQSSMDIAVRHAERIYPIGAFAVEQVTYEIGDSGGRRAIAVNIRYRRSTAEILRIRSVADMEEAREVAEDALEKCSAGVVMHVANYAETDFFQIVQDYAQLHPELVMETPQVTSVAYGSGEERVVELTFAYQTSRDSLRSMKSQVRPVFESAALYVSGEAAQYRKYAQLYAFLMERFDYAQATSITPAYSLLHHGVGDSRAFATVYAAMCRMAGLEAMTVTGTCNGSPRTWNIVQDNGRYYHVDLLRCNSLGGFREFTDGEMGGYVWDYSAYPQCLAAPVPQTTEPVPEATEPLMIIPETTGEIPME